MSTYNKNSLPDTTTSYWIDSVNLPTFPKLEKNINVDICIVGGGITGITSAFLLANEGKKVAVLEADHVLNGTTGHTTAKLTAQHGLIYNKLMTNLSRSKAKLYYEANMEAIRFVKNMVEKFNIDCDLEKQDAYIYATTDKYAHKIEQEIAAYEKLDINGGEYTDFPFDFSVKNMITMRNQAQFHPLKFLSFLLDKAAEKGVQFFENTTAVNVKGDGEPAVLTRDNHRVTAKYVLACSHFPFYEGLGLYSTRLYANRSYVLAIKPKKEHYPGGTYISAESPARSIRSVHINGENALLIVGEDHKTGQGKDTMEHYQALAEFAEKTFGIEKIYYRWSAQDLITLDKVPYVGPITSGAPHVMVATGYRKWGMSNGIAAALLLRDIILNKKNPFKDLYSPGRFNATPSIKNFLKENGDVVSHLIAGKMQVSKVDPDTLKNDEGAVIQVNGERKGAYRDKDGELHIVDTTCTHIGCELQWNSGDRSWDCPCHGSRFSYTGDVLNGPAEKPLQKYDYKMLDNLFSDDSGY